MREAASQKDEGCSNRPITYSKETLSRAGREWQLSDRRERRGQRYWCHISAKHILMPPSILTKPDTPLSFPALSDSSKQALQCLTHTYMCSHAVHRYAYKATRTHQLLAAVVGVLSGGGAVWQKQKSTGPRTSSVNLNLDFVVQQCSFPLIAQLLEVIQTQACEKLSPQIKSRTSSMPACSPGRYMRVCECRSDNEEVGSGRDEFQLPRFALGYRCHSWT